MPPRNFSHGMPLTLHDDRVPMSRNCKIQVLIAVPILGLLILLVLPGRGVRELDRWKAAARARGEKLSLAELRPTWDSNILAYQRRLTSVVSRLQFKPLEPALVELQAAGTGVLARPIWRQPAPAPRQLPSGTWEELESQVDASAGPLHELHELVATWPRGVPWSPAAPFSPGLPNFVSIRKGAQFMAGAVAAELHRGRLDAALTNLHALLDLSGYARDGGTLVEGMIGVAVGGLAQAAAWEALQAPGWDEPRLLRLQRALEDHDWVAFHLRTLEVERAFALAYFEQTREGRVEFRDFLISFGNIPSDPLARKFHELVRLPLWRSRWSHRDELRYLERLQPTLEAMRNLTNHCSWQELSASFNQIAATTPPTTSFDGFRFPMSEAVAVQHPKAAQNMLRIETRRQLAVAAVALQRHHLRHGAFPESLAALAPEFLSTLPRDPMNGGKLHYRRAADGSLTLYSVGQNGQDDSGGGDDERWATAAKE